VGLSLRSSGRASVWCCGALAVQACGGQLSRPSRDQSRLTRHCGRPHPGPAATCAACSSSFSSSAFELAGPGANPSSPPTSEPPRVSTAASTAAVLEHFRGQLLLLNPRAAAAIRPASRSLAGGLLPYLDGCWRQPPPSAPATRPRSLPSGVGRGLSGGQRSRQQCEHRPGRPWPPTGTLPSRGLGGTLGGSGSIKPSSASCPAMTNVQGMWARIPNPAWRLAYGCGEPMACATTRFFFCDLSPLAPKAAIRVLRGAAHSKTGEHQVWWPYIRMGGAFSNAETGGSQPVALRRCVTI